MKGGKTQGYTIVETLIFLAVSGLLSAVAFAMVAGKQQQAEFDYGVRDFASRIQDIVNDVSTGFYENPGGFNCTAEPTGGEPTFSTTPPITEQGKNEKCIFIGRVIQFAPSDTPDPNDSKKSYRVFSVAGRRLAEGETRDVVELTEAMPVALSPSSSRPNNPDLTSIYVNPYGITTEWIRYVPQSIGVKVGAIGFFTNFDSNNQLESDARNVNVIPIINTGLEQTMLAMAESIKTANEIHENPPEGLIICLDSSNKRNHALLTIGGNLRQLTTNLEIKADVCDKDPLKPKS